jgi:hypothetical protein
MNPSPAEPLLLWIGGSLSAGLVARALAVRLPALGHAGLGRWAAELALLLYYVGWPSLALFDVRALSADLMGLGRIGVIDAGLVLGLRAARLVVAGDDSRPGSGLCAGRGMVGGALGDRARTG